MEEKIFTFTIEFQNEDEGRKDETQFCAETEEKAVELFNLWCLMDCGAKKPYPVISVLVEYNEDDAKEYGENYGTPEEYDVD